MSTVITLELAQDLTEREKQMIAYTIRDSLTDFVLTRTPSFAYVYKRYPAHHNKQAKIQQVEQRIQLVKALHKAKISIV